MVMSSQGKLITALCPMLLTLMTRAPRLEALSLSSSRLVSRKGPRWLVCS